MLTIDKIKRAVLSVIVNYPVKRIDLFGSYAEGTNTTASDVDLMVEFQTPAISLLTLSSMRCSLEDALDTEVDLIHGPLNENALITLGKVVPIYEG